MNDPNAEYIKRRQEEIGHRIRVLRAEKDWTQAEAAERLGWSRQRFNRIEQGMVELAVPEMELVAKVFGVAPCHFLKEAS